MSGHFQAGLKGLLLGDGLSRQNSVERLALTTKRRINRFQTLTKFSFDNGITTFPEPYVHAFPQKILRLFPGDDSEWFYFSTSIAKNGSSAKQEWQKLSTSRENVRARLGTKTALRNLAEGLSAPMSGHDNPHYFDSISMLRAAGIASIVEGDLEYTLMKIEEDVTQTHSLDGIWCAKSIGALVYFIKTGEDLKSSLIKSLEQIPENSLTSQIMKSARLIYESANDEIQLALDLEQRLVDRIYCYPYSSSELLALIYSGLWLNSDTKLKFTTSFLHRRHNDSLPALLGYLLGYIFGDNWLPEIETSSFTMDGLCIPELRGKNLLDLLG